MHPVGSLPVSIRLRPLVGFWLILILLLHSACATGVPRGSISTGRTTPPEAPPVPRQEVALAAEAGLESARLYTVDFLEPSASASRPVPVLPADFRRAFQRLSRDMRVTGSPHEAARELLSLTHQLPPEAEHMEMAGQWLMERYGERTYTFVPLDQFGPEPLTPEADAALRDSYLSWCVPRGGGDCLCLLEDGPFLRTDDRRVLALAVALGPVLDETRAALARELLDVRAVVSLVAWTVTLYCLLWVLPEPTTKALAATLTVILVGWLGVETVWGLMDGYSRMAMAAHEASTFAELRAAGADFGRLLGEDAARAMILAVATLSGRTLGEVAARVKSLPGHGLASARWEAQGGAGVLRRAGVGEWAQGEALAHAVVAVDTVALSPQGPLAVVLLKQKTGSGAARAPGGRSAATVLQHRGGNRQMELSDGQRWHVPRGKSLADIPPHDKVGDQLQEAVTRAAKQWGPDKLSRNEQRAIERALEKGDYWQARLLEREARGRYVQQQVKTQFEHLYDFSLSKGVDVVDPANGRKYEILSGTASNMARHGRRMAGEFFRMLTF
uniref:Lipoprotein n=1 Tax=Cystobacter fuscus TaxID=43 RepID=A0A3S7UX32_9BACT|nr:lipoprotein [Cystobacter fuscus]